MEVDFSPEEFGEFVLHRKKSKARNVPWFEFH